MDGALFGIYAECPIGFCVRPDMDVVRFGVLKLALHRAWLKLEFGWRACARSGISSTIGFDGKPGWMENS